mmetsp:Transcript_20737/g.43233  ORF Transcript_20737/g.43233 Transcript_20737/m.43233 type:complete len:339 (-) Transcript_20737:42-1058(-)
MSPASTDMVRLLCVSIFALCLSQCACMNIAECNKMSGFTGPLEGMSGFKVYVDGYTSGILDDASESQDEHGNPRTYRECLAHATSEARSRLSNRTNTNEAGEGIFELALSKVPLKIMNGASSSTGDEGAQHFAYSGSCAQGCVYSHMPERLIRDIANSPDLFMHEYAHVLHLASMDSSESRAIGAAYTDFMQTKLPALETKYSETYEPGGCCFWYSATNDKEFFAVTTQAYFLDDGEQRWDWPKSSTLLQSEDAEAYSAVVDYWSIDPDEFAAHLGNCKIPLWETMDQKLIIAGLAGVLLLFGIGLCCLIKRCCSRRGRKGKADKDEGGRAKIQLMAI